MTGSAAESTSEVMTSGMATRPETAGRSMTRWMTPATSPNPPLPNRPRRPAISATPVIPVPAATPDAGARLFVSPQTSTPPPVEETAPDLAAAARPTPVPPEDLIPAILEIPKAAIDAAAAFVAVLLWPILGPGPGTPTPPVTLFAVLDWLRREVNRAFFNTAPKAVADEFTTGQDLDTTGNVLTNDTDVDGDRLTAKLVTGPAHGDVVLNADGSFSYTPDTDFHGTDSFSYTVSDGTSSPHLHGLLGLFGQGHTDGAPATVRIAVLPGQLPYAGYDSLSTKPDEPLTIDPDTLLANDFDALGRPLQVQHKDPEYGTLQVDDEGNLVYTPEEDFVGEDTFEYSATNSAGDVSDPAVVTIFVGVKANTAPTGTPDAVTTYVDTPLVILPGDLAGNDADAEDDELAPYLVSKPLYGEIESVGGTFIYTPSPGFTGTEQFYYSTFDGYTDSLPVLVTIEVAGERPTDNQWPVPGYDSLGTEIDTTLTIDLNTLRLNDFDTEADPTTIIVTQPPVNGSLSTDSNGNLVYTPDTGFVGTDAFYYSAADADRAGPPARVTIAVGVDANASPVAKPDTLQALANTALTFTDLDLVGNDEDSDNDTPELEAFPVSGPSHGSLEWLDDELIFVYTPNPSHVGTDSFYYTAFDGTSDSVPTLVTIQIAASAL